VNHELRHTAAATWLSLGLGLEYVRRQMGHKTITTTIRNYAHLEPSMLPAAAARAEAGLLGTVADAANGQPSRNRPSPRRIAEPNRTVVPVVTVSPPP
jgi:hypothetical protein